MNYLSLYDYLKDITQNLDLTVKFFHGRKELLNLTDNNKPIYVYSLPFIGSGGFTTAQQEQETWQVNLFVYMQDQPDSGIDQNDEDNIQAEVRCLTITEKVADKIIHFINDNTLSDELEAASELVTITSFNKQPVIRDTAQMLTGWLVTINLLVDDSFDYCTA